MLTPSTQIGYKPSTKALDQDPRACPDCGSTFNSFRAINLHMIRKHDKPAPDSFRATLLSNPQLAKGGTPKSETVPHEPSSLPPEPEPLSNPEPIPGFPNCEKCGRLFQKQDLRPPYCIDCLRIYG